MQNRMKGGNLSLKEKQISLSLLTYSKVVVLRLAAEIHDAVVALVLERIPEILESTGGGAMQSAEGRSRSPPLMALRGTDVDAWHLDLHRRSFS